MARILSYRTCEILYVVSLSLPKPDMCEAMPTLEERSGGVAGGRVNSANFGVQARHKGGMNSLEVLAERLQDAISDTVSMTGPPHNSLLPITSCWHSTGGSKVCIYDDKGVNF